MSVSDNCITIAEVGRYGAAKKWYSPSAPVGLLPSPEGWEYHYVIDFAFGDPSTIAISGYEVDDDPNRCQGDVAANGTASSAIESSAEMSGGSSEGATLSLICNY